MAGTMSESCTTTRCAASRHSRVVSMCARAAAARRSVVWRELSMKARPCWCETPFQLRDVVVAKTLRQWVGTRQADGVSCCQQT